jgi:hypothetical protein
MAARPRRTFSITPPPLIFASLRATPRCGTERRPRSKPSVHDPEREGKWEDRQFTLPQRIHPLAAMGHTASTVSLRVT